MTQSDIQIIHNLYCRLTGFELRLTMDRERCWYECLKIGINEEDLRLVIPYLKRGIDSEERKRGCLKFSNTIAQWDKFEEEIASAKAYWRNNMPRTNREAIVQSFRPSSSASYGGQAGEARAKPAKDVLIRLTEELRKAAG